MLKILKIIDVYGMPHNFTIFGSQLHTTAMGGFLTIVTLILYILSFIYFGKDFYQRMNPKYVHQLYTKDEYSLANLSNENFMLGINVETGDFGGSLDYNTYFNITYNYIRVDYIDNTSEKIPLNQIDCNLYNFKKMRLFNTEVLLTLPGLKCFNMSNIKLGGYYDGEYVETIEVIISPCINSSSVNYCKTDDEVKSLLSQGLITFNIYTINYFLKLSDYVNPLSLGIQNSFTQIDYDIGKDYNIFYKEASIKSDMGLLISDPLEYNVIGYDYQSFDNYFIDHSLDRSSLAYMKFYFYLWKNYESFEVTYIKIQDIFASLGGIMNFISIFIRTMAGFLNNHEKAIALINQNFEFQDITNENKLRSIIEERKVKKERKKNRNNLSFEKGNDNKPEFKINELGESNIIKEDKSSKRIMINDLSNDIIQERVKFKTNEMRIDISIQDGKEKDNTSIINSGVKKSCIENSKKEGK